MTACASWENDRSADTGPWFVPFTVKGPSTLGHERKWVTDGGGVWTVDSPRAMFDVLETFGEIGLDGPLTGYLGERPALSVKKWTLRRVPITSGTNWHQDGAFLGQGIRTVNCWLTLSHCGDDAPGLDIVPRRMDRILPTGTDGAMFDWSVGEQLVERGRRGRTGASPDLRTRRRVVLRRALLAPNRGERDDDARAVCDRVLVLRAVPLSGRPDTRWCSESEHRRLRDAAVGPQILLR